MNVLINGEFAAGVLTEDKYSLYWTKDEKNFVLFDGKVKIASSDNVKTCEWVPEPNRFELENTNDWEMSDGQEVKKILILPNGSKAVLTNLGLGVANPEGNFSQNPSLKLKNKTSSVAEAKKVIDEYYNKQSALLLAVFQQTKTEEFNKILESFQTTVATPVIQALLNIAGQHLKLRGHDELYFSEEFQQVYREACKVLLKDSIKLGDVEFYFRDTKIANTQKLLANTIKAYNDYKNYVM